MPYLATSRAAQGSRTDRFDTVTETMGVIIPARGPGEAVRDAPDWPHTRSQSGRESSNIGKRQFNWDPPRPPPLSQVEDFATTAALPEPTSARETITNGQRCGFYAGIASLAVSPVIIVLAVLYFVRRRRALQRLRKLDVTQPRDSLHPYKLDDATHTEPGAAEEQDPKHVLQGPPGEKGTAAQDDSEDARQSSASSLDDPENLARLRRVMKQAGFTVDAMVAGLNRIARSSSFGGALSRTPTNPPPVYER